MNRAVFRADASMAIGSGHIMRCLTLADALDLRGWNCVFVGVSACCDIVPRLDGGSHSFIALEEAMATDPEALLRLGPSDLLIVDHYDLDADFETACRKTASRILVIDDLANRRHDCDMLLDQNYRQSETGRYDALVPEDCIVKTGAKYALLQPEYARLRAKVRPRERVERLLIYFGGVDLADMTGRALRAALGLERKELQIDVVVSAGSPNAPAIQDMAGRHSTVTCHQGLPSLAPLIAASDLSVGAMGATSWERLCLGLPTIGVTIADNQDEVAAELRRAGMVDWLGEQADVSEAAIANAIEAALGSDRLRDWSRRCMTLCDGLGVQRIADDLVALFKET